MNGTYFEIKIKMEFSSHSDCVKYRLKHALFGYRVF